MKRCPKCGAMSFVVTAHVTQDWVVDENGDFINCEDDCVEVTHFPDDTDFWTCNNCGHYDIGTAFNVQEKEENGCEGNSHERLG